MKKLEAAFKLVLAEMEVDHESEWSEIRPKLEDDEAFLAIPSETERLRIFNEYILEMEEACGHYHSRSKKAKKKKNRLRSRSRSASLSDRSETRQSHKKRRKHHSSASETEDDKHLKKKSKKSKRRREDSVRYFFILSTNVIFNFLTFF